MQLQARESGDRAASRVREDKDMARALRSALIALLAALALTGSAQAAGGNYVFEGGNAKARAQVTAALEASSFDWNVVPVQVTIHIGAGNTPHAETRDI